MWWPCESLLVFLCWNPWAFFWERNASLLGLWTLILFGLHLLDGNSSVSLFEQVVGLLLDVLCLVRFANTFLRYSLWEFCLFDLFGHVKRELVLFWRLEPRSGLLLVAVVRFGNAF